MKWYNMVFVCTVLLLNFSSPSANARAFVSGASTALLFTSISQVYFLFIPTPGRYCIWLQPYWKPKPAGWTSLLMRMLGYASAADDGISYGSCVRHRLMTAIHQNHSMDMTNNRNSQEENDQFFCFVSCCFCFGRFIEVLWPFFFSFFLLLCTRFLSQQMPLEL